MQQHIHRPPYGGHVSAVRQDDETPERDMDEMIQNVPVSASGWSEIEPAGMIPSARSLHSAAILNDTLLVFGGYDGRERVNSFHAYSFAEKRWSPVSAINRTMSPSPKKRSVMECESLIFKSHSSLFRFLRRQIRGLHQVRVTDTRPSPLAIPFTFMEASTVRLAMLACSPLTFRPWHGERS
jgi:hypothetical protein